MTKDQLAWMNLQAYIDRDKAKISLYDTALKGDADAITEARADFRLHAAMVLETLLSVRDLIGRGWTQHTNARDKDGLIIFAQAETATCWCLTGAVEAALSTHRPRTLMHQHAVEGAIVHAVESKNVINMNKVTTWNDNPHRTKAEVTATCERAVAEYTLTAG